jgi:aspartate racemase
MTVSARGVAVREKIIGILGGMGPEATLDLFGKIIKATPAACDQEHLRVIIDNNPKIPDRQRAIFGGGEEPRRALIETARNLQRAGAQLMLIPCNSAHYYHKAIVDSVPIPVLNIMEETAAYCRRQYSSIGLFGLLATESTVELGLYNEAFSRVSLKIVVPSSEDQQKVTGSIYKIKAGDHGPTVKTELLSVVEHLGDMGAGAIILGCTEIPLVLKDGDHGLPFVDATQVLAESGVAMARTE